MTSVSAAERMRTAKAAQLPWARLPISARCPVLARLRVEIADRSDEIVRVIREDTGKVALDALGGDVMVALEQMRFYERQAAKTLKSRNVGKPAFFYSGASFRESYEPHGVVLIYSPYNYPFQLSMVPLITALIAGNAVILKCSEKAPGVTALIADLCRSAQLPPGLVQVVDDPPDRALELLDAHPDMVFFTGSSTVGRIIAKRAAELLIPTVMELGGKDPGIVFADCNLERTVEGVAYGAFLHAGQVCVGIKRLYVEQAIYDVFLRKLIERAASLRISEHGDADLPSFGPVSTCEALASQIQEAVHFGAIIAWPKDSPASGKFPIILTNVPADSRLMREETFGPVLCVFPFHDEQDVIAQVNAVPFALSASVWTGNRSRGVAIASQVNAGSCAINDVIRNIANPYASFGGNGVSGHGRYHGPQGLFAFSRIKSVMTAHDRKNSERHWFPFTRKTLTSLNRLLKFRHRAGPVGSMIGRFIPLFICGLLSLAVESQPARHPGHLIISVTAPVHAHAEIAYLVFASPRGFPNDRTKALKRGFVPVPLNNSPVVIDAGELEPGRYAVSVYEDVNGNQKLDMGILGIPKEPVGASNNPAPHFGPPHFDECAFNMGNSDQKIAISLVKHNG